MLYFAIAIYAAALVAANLSVAAFGTSTVAINAFFLIGLDLALRDWLHLRIRSWQMLVLILSTGLITYLLNPTAGIIAVASAVAFSAAALTDWLVFVNTKGSWLSRANLSNVFGAAVDSVAFPIIAFGSVDPRIMLTLFAAKVAGGAAWAYAINRRVQA